MFEIGQLTRLPLGYVGENGTRTISIDMKAWLDEYPGALIMVQVIRPVDRYKYPAAYTKTDGVIHWTVDGSEVMYAGKGLAQIALYNPDTKQEYKSRVVGTIVAESLDGFNDILLEETDPASKWVNQVLEAAESAEASKNDAANSKEEAAAAITIVATQKNEALIAIQNEGAAQVVSVNDAGAQQAQLVEAKGEEVLGKIPEDYTELSNSVATLTKDIARNTAPPIIPTATGEVVTVSDSANRPLAGLRLYGKTTQDGVPSPNSPVPLVNVGAGGSIWVKASGKNIFDASPDGAQCIGGAYVNDHSYDYSITPNDRCYAYRIGVSGGQTLVVSTSANEMLANVRYEDAAQNLVGGISWFNLKNKSFVVPAQAAYLVLSIEKTLVDQYTYQIETGSIATAYELYKDGGGLLASTPGGLAGIPTEGGMICDYKDYGNGANVHHVYVPDAASVEWNPTNNINHAGNGYVFFTVFNSILSSRDMMSNRFKENRIVPSESWDALNAGEATVIVDSGSGVEYLVICMPAEISTVDKLNAYFAANPTTFLCARKMPVITPIPADELAAFRAMMSQYPHTTVYNDAGAGMAVDYIADTKLYIDNKLAAIAAATL